MSSIIQAEIKKIEGDKKKRELIYQVRHCIEKNSSKGEYKISWNSNGMMTKFSDLPDDVISEIRSILSLPDEVKPESDNESDYESEYEYESE